MKRQSMHVGQLQVLAAAALGHVESIGENPISQQLRELEESFEQLQGFGSKPLDADFPAPSFRRPNPSILLNADKVATPPWQADRNPARVNKHKLKARQRNGGRPKSRKRR